MGWLFVRHRKSLPFPKPNVTLLQFLYYSSPAAKSTELGGNPKSINTSNTMETCTNEIRMTATLVKATTLNERSRHSLGTDLQYTFASTTFVESTMSVNIVARTELEVILGYFNAVYKLRGNTIPNRSIHAAAQAMACPWQSMEGNKPMTPNSHWLLMITTNCWNKTN